MALLDDLTSIENLQYAWRKARALFHNADGYINGAELTAFELNLEIELASIRSDLRAFTYQLALLRPLPRPKKIEDEKYLDRQYFHVCVRDQVTWIAVTNILGPRLDPKMPPWSYNYRIYRTAWFDRSEEKTSPKLELGPYRHASGQLYRKFSQSWPLFRRQIFRTAHFMSGKYKNAEEAANADPAEQNAFLIGVADNLPYFTKGFWRRPSNANGSDLYMASLDFEKFFPNISRQAIIQATIENLDADDREIVARMLGLLLAFEIDFDGTPECVRSSTEPPFEDFGNGKGIPTGLFAAGFLANIVMLPIDKKIALLLQGRHNIAHFRYVDDHTILAYTFDHLCDWVDLYQKIIDEASIGVSLNSRKFDPKAFGEYLAYRSGKLKSEEPIDLDKLKAAAISDCRIDGSNPTKLRTRTLTQVSAIAAGNIHVMDDDDLRERIKILEWLLLADIPEREIRPDTRAAFAAGQIAALVPLLIQEEDGLIDTVRSLRKLEAEIRDQKRLASKSNTLERLLSQQKKLLNDHKEKQKKLYGRERLHYKHHFNLLMESFKQFPGKPRLFYRLCHYCLLTGHHGLQEIGAWIDAQRKRKSERWADYYAGLTLQILSDTSLRAIRTLGRSDALHAERRAAASHLDDIAGIKTVTFLVPETEAAWFHHVARNELIASLLAAAEISRDRKSDRLAERLVNTAQALDSKAADLTVDVANWVKRTPYSAGVWAERTEQGINPNGAPSVAWQAVFLPLFDRGARPDVLAVRRYPECLPDEWWQEFVSNAGASPDDDAGWWRDSLAAHLVRLPEAEGSACKAIRNAAVSLLPQRRPESQGSVDIPTIDGLEWVQFTREKCSAFDPRKSEWTALEIVKSLVSTVIQLEGSRDDLRHIHPANIRIPVSWQERPMPSWEEWHDFTRNNRARFAKGPSNIEDYRYVSAEDQNVDNWRRQLVGIGRLLLGLLSNQFRNPRIWNIRGNERAYPLARGAAYEALTVSSNTLLILEGCLSARSAENWQLLARPGLFGLYKAVTANDAGFDAPILLDPESVLLAIERAKVVLESNQVAVSRNQPRQLIPFRLTDFAKGAFNQEQDQADVE